MIIDELIHLNKYTPLHPGLQKVVDFLAQHDLSALADGRYPLGAEEDGFVNVQTIPAKGREEAVLESHKAMVDVQIPLTGDETMGYSTLSCVEETPYNQQQDITFHSGRADSYVTVRKGMFAIFFPQDVHAPGIVSADVKKAVFKIPVQEKETI